MRTTRILAALAASLAVAGPAAAQTPTDGWLADLDQLRDGLSAGYANLEWQAARGMDLPAAYAQARARLQRAPDEAAARRAIERFLERFGDGHLEIRWPSAPRPGGPAAAATPAPRPTLCARIAYASPDNTAVAERLQGYQPVGDAILPAGILSVEGRRVGVLRIAAFDPFAIPGFCERAAAENGLTDGMPCDETCEDKIGRTARRMFRATMAAQIRVLIANKPDVLLVDVAGNGGGDDSALSLARMLTTGPLSAPRVGLLRTVAWDKELGEQQADIRAALKGAQGRIRTELIALDNALTLARGETQRPCDRAPLWQGRAIDCSNVVIGTLYATGLTAGTASWTPDAPWAGLVSKWAADPFARPLWSGPLLILVDGDSASSTELFTALLQDAHAAVVLGAPTAGAGCGHMTGAKALRLANSGGQVSMPDCLRLRADGSNEVGGIEPDVLIGFRPYDSPAERVRRLTAALPRALAAGR